MRTIIQTRGCEGCGKTLAGRADKRFCSGWCRSAYNNAKRAHFQPELRRINSILVRNRNILVSFLSPGKTCRTISPDELTTAGYAARFCTHVTADHKGRRVQWCYDAGVKEMGNERLRLIMQNETAE